MGRADALKPGRHKGGHPPLPRADLPIEAVSLARYLIGKILVREMAEGIASGRIVETEAYVVGDAAGHAYRGMTPRNRSLFLERGHAYVYLAYGSAYMLNVSSEMAGIGAGVLIRALEPRDGIPIMQRNRQIERLRDLARGPGRLTAALRVDRRLDGLDLCREALSGSDAAITNPAKSGRASGSASSGTRTGSCDFIFVAVRSSAVQDCLGNKRPYHGCSPPLRNGGRHSKSRLFRLAIPSHCMNSSAADEPAGPSRVAPMSVDRTKLTRARRPESRVWCRRLKFKTDRMPLSCANSLALWGRCTRCVRDRGVAIPASACGRIPPT